MEFRTIVAFDLETTGLNTSSVRITELAALAITREHFLKCSAEFFDKSGGDKAPDVLPRVIAKICIPIEPDVVIESGAARVSGLKNDMLRSCGSCASGLEAFGSFLKRLIPPICVVAHNGVKFDFKVLKAEIFRNKSELDESTLNSLKFFVFDTCVWLPRLDKAYLDDIDAFMTNLATDKASPSSLKSELKNNGGAELWKTPPAKQSSSGSTNEKRVAKSLFADNRDDSATVGRVELGGGDFDRSVQSDSPNFTLLKRLDIDRSGGKDRRAGGVVGESGLVANTNSIRVEEISIQSEAGIDLVGGVDCVSVQSVTSVEGVVMVNDLVPAIGSSLASRLLVENFMAPPTSYSQSAVYLRFFKQPIKFAHSADGDCMALLRILLCYGGDIVKLIDSHAVMFQYD